jgi:Fe-S oxidoreductase
MALRHLEQTGNEAPVMMMWGLLAAQARAEYERIRWADYEMVFVTHPGWAPTLPASLIVDLAEVIHRASPDTDVRYFGTSLGTWTDIDALALGGVRPVHLNSLLAESPWLGPIDYDRLPTPTFRDLDGYIFRMLPFRLRHGCCWGKCRFCSISRGAGSGYLERSVERVAVELAELVEAYDPVGLVCHDNAVNGGRIIPFCERIGNLGKPWLCAARSDLSPEEVRALARSGCKGVYLGIESGSEHVLAAMDKGTTVKDHDRVLRMLSSEGIEPVPSVFVGAPWETEEAFAATCRLLRRHRGRVHIVNVYKFRWSPGTDAQHDGGPPHENTEHRYDALVQVCRENDMLPVPGITTLEYLFARLVCPEKQRSWAT